MEKRRNGWQDVRKSSLTTIMIWLMIPKLCDNLVLSILSRGLIGRTCVALVIWCVYAYVVSSYGVVKDKNRGARKYHNEVRFAVHSMVSAFNKIE